MRIKAVDDAVVNVFSLSNNTHNASKRPAQAIGNSTFVRVFIITIRLGAIMMHCGQVTLRDDARLSC